MRQALKISLLALFIFSVSSFPSFLALWQQAEGEGLIDLPEMVSNIPYFSTVIQYQNNHLLAKNLYTPEMQERIFFFPSYFLVARLGGSFVLFKFLACILLAVGAVVFSQTFFGKKHRFLNSLVLIFSGGFGFFLNWFIPTSFDLTLPQMTIFYSLLKLPPQIYLFALVMLGISVKSPILRALFFSFIVLENPFIFITLALSFFLSGLFTKSLSRIIFILPALAIFWLQILLLFLHRSSLAWLSQIPTATPSLLSLVSGMGILGVTAFIFLIRENFAKMTETKKFFFFWILSAIFLEYLPLGLRHRFLEGLQIPVFSLALYYLPKVKILVQKRIFWVGIFILLFTTPIYLLFSEISRQKDYFSQADLEGINFLKNTVSEKEVILADGFYTDLIPVLTGKTVFFGYRYGQVLTYDYRNKVEQAEKFFVEENDVYRQDFLQTNNIRYLFLGKKGSEAEDFKKWDEKKYLKKIYQGEGVKIYETKI